MRENYESKKPLKRVGKQGDHFQFLLSAIITLRGSEIIVIVELLQLLSRA